MKKYSFLLLTLAFVCNMQASRDKENHIDNSELGQIIARLSTLGKGKSKDDLKNNETYQALSKYIEPPLSKMTLDYLKPNYFIFANTFFSGRTQSQIKKFLDDGKVDLSFGQAGKVDCPCNSISLLEIQNDGSILAIGNDPITNKLVIARFLRNGVLDNSFGSGTGFITTDSTSNAKYLALQPNGKIIASDYSYPFKSEIFSYNQNGIKDDSFAKSGKISLESSLTGLAIQSDGKIIFSNGSQIYRHLNNGIRDITFHARINLPNSNITTIKLLDNDDIIVAYYNHTDSNTTILKLLKNGALDSNFASINAKGDFPNVKDFMADILNIQDNGKILAAGLWNNKSQLKILSLLDNGQIDKAFGNDGIISIELNIEIRDIQILNTNQGKIIVGGIKSRDDYFLISLNSDGSEDKEFNEV